MAEVSVSDTSDTSSGQSERLRDLRERYPNARSPSPYYGNEDLSQTIGRQKGNKLPAKLRVGKLSEESVRLRTGDKPEIAFSRSSLTAALKGAGRRSCRNSLRPKRRASAVQPGQPAVQAAAVPAPMWSGTQRCITSRWSGASGSVSLSTSAGQCLLAAVAQSTASAHAAYLPDCQC